MKFQELGQEFSEIYFKNRFSLYDNEESKMICPYCQSSAKLESSRKVYGGRDFGLLYLCEKYPVCDSYVGVHKGTNKPLGRLANSELREWKKRAHSAFDPIWQKKMIKKKRARGSAYKWLASQLNITFDECHIGMFDVEQCKRVVEICVTYLKERKIHV